MTTSNTLMPLAFRVRQSRQAAACLCTLVASLFLFMSTCLLLPQTAVAQNKTIVIFAPHPDDEALCCAGVIYAAEAQGDVVWVVVVTNGDDAQLKPHDVRNLP